MTPSTAMAHDERPASTSRRTGFTLAFAAVVAVGAQLLAGLAVLVSGLVVPDGVRLAFGTAWILGVARMLDVRRRPVQLLAVPAVTWAGIVLTVVAGDLWLGWTA